VNIGVELEYIGSATELHKMGGALASVYIGNATQILEEKGGASVYRNTQG
jgi:hypothetical protein